MNEQDKKMNDYLSKCCNAPVMIYGMPDFIGDDQIVTVHYTCTKCQKPCDIYVEKRKVVFESDFRV